MDEQRSLSFAVPEVAEPNHDQTVGLRHAIQNGADGMADQKKRLGTSSRGFASMDERKQREIASKGGQASGGNFANNPERASKAGKKGGQASGGNFAKDPERASEAGKKGGQASHNRGGSLADGRDRASEGSKDSAESGQDGSAKDN